MRQFSYFSALIAFNFLQKLAGQGFDPKPEDFAEFVDRIKDTTTPLPSCEEVGSFEALTCQALCIAIDGGGVVLDDTRLVDGKWTCACESQVACSDSPTCGQLALFPGNVQEGCEAICGDGFAVSVDEVEYPGAITSANKDLTHFVMQCRCDGQVICDDYILFSDLKFPNVCSDLGVTSNESCNDFCDTAGGGLFDLGGNLTVLDDGVLECDCSATSLNALRDVDTTLACTDTPVDPGPEACTLQNPCPTDPPGGSGGESGVSATCVSYAMVLVAVTMMINVSM